MSAFTITVTTDCPQEMTRVLVVNAATQIAAALDYDGVFTGRVFAQDIIAVATLVDHRIEPAEPS